MLDTIFNPILNALGFLLSLFYALPPHNLGVAIILLTFGIMLALYPLTAKQARSMIAMQMVQPEIKRIQAKHKNDKAKLNEEMMAFYQENKINPLAGCLPLLVQMPIFFALFRVLSDPYKYVPESSKLYSFLCTNAAGITVNAEQCGKAKGLPNPTYFLGMNLSLSAPDQLNTWAKFLAFALVVLVMFTGYMQSRQAAKRTPAINKQMALITKVLPVFFGFISLNFPAGLVVYFFVSNLWRLGQQEVIFRQYGSAADPKHHKLKRPPKAAIVDAESRETAVAVEEPREVEEKNPPKSGGKALGAGGSAKSSPAAKSGKTNGASSSGKPVIAASSGGGGLRGLFKPPPPASGKPTPTTSAKPAAKPAPKKTSTGSSSTSRPGEAGRRTSKKKKKR